jgi:hypothetical protein
VDCFENQIIVVNTLIIIFSVLNKKNMLQYENFQGWKRDLTNANFIGFVLNRPWLEHLISRICEEHDNLNTNHICGYWGYTINIENHTIYIVMVACESKSLFQPWKFSYCNIFFLFKTENIIMRVFTTIIWFSKQSTWLVFRLSCSSQMRDIKCSSHGRFKTKPIKLAFVASALYT